MRLTLWLVVGAMACSGTAPPPVASSPAVAPTEPTARAAEPMPPAPDTLRWDPATPVEPSTLTTRWMYVVVDASAICPTPEQARARQCGHSVEDVAKGVRRRLGSAVTVVGDRPVDGLWRSFRYQKAGVLPGWIAAQDVAAKPRTQFLDAFDQRKELATAKDATALSRAELAGLRKGTVVAWKRTRTIRFGAFAGTVFIYTDRAAIELPGPEVDPSYLENHDCLIEGDCRRLAYVCDDTYCDEVSVVARATGRKTEPAPDPRGEWTPPAKSLPVFELVVLADRFGVFEGMPPSGGRSK